MVDPAALSPAQRAALDLLRKHGLEGALAKADEVLHSLSIVQQAGHEADWFEWWARPKQLPPPGDWQSWGFLTGRGFGKTLAVSRYLNREVSAQRARLILLMAQKETDSVQIQVEGPSGLIATAPYDNRPTWHASSLELHWPNGAVAYVRTPEVPSSVRGLEYDHAWLTELQSWPTVHREYAFAMALLSTRLRHARIVWDATPKRRHPVLLRLLRNHERDPSRHVIVRGSTHENAANLARGYVQKLEDEYGGTSRGREELLGEMLDDSDAALFKQSWIDAARRPLPDRLVRRVLAVDPAVTTRAGNDSTGIIDAGLGVDGQAYILGDHTGKYRVEEWSKLLVDLYVKHDCDCLVVETNKALDHVTFAVRSYAQTRHINVVVVGKNERVPPRASGVVYVREVYARGEKADRAQPLATAYERGRVSHVEGANLSELEDLMTTWEPEAGKRSPDRLDACVHAVVELLGLASDRPDAKAGFKGITEAARTLAATRPSVSLTSALYRKGGGGGKI